MNLSRTAVVLIAVLFVLICVSVYSWFFWGGGRSEVDPRIGSLRQSFTCEQCGYAFTMTTEEVGQMRRSRGQVHCPKCGAGGARKDIGAVPSSLLQSEASQPAAGRDAPPAAGPPDSQPSADAVLSSPPGRESGSTAQAGGRSSK